MTDRRWPMVVMAAVVLTLSCGLAGAKDVPFLSGRVNDLANMIPDATETRLETQLELLENDTSAQIAVLTIKSLEGDSLEQFSLRVAETWKLGRDAFDDGALLLVSRGDRKMRLEVGYGLEPVLTDAMSKRILDEVMRPRFRAGDFDGGIFRSVAAIDGLVRGQEASALLPKGSGGAKKGRISGGLVIFGFVSLIVGLFSVVALTSKGGHAWAMYVFLMPFWGIFPLAIFGWWVGALPLAIWIVLFPVLRLLMRSNTGMGHWMSTTSSAWVSSSKGWSSSQGWSGGGGGGGFSGGGGSFGGGGASSGW